MCSSDGLVQLVSRPTRITDGSATLIDHVYTNNVDNIKSCNILTVDLTDHLATLTKISFITSGGTLSNLTIKIRAVIPGFINYRYRSDGTLLGHTKSYFAKYDILTNKCNCIKCPSIHA